jgi:hypothetical protein
MNWTKEFPTKENDGRWYVVRRFGKVDFMEIRVESDGRIFLSEPCNVGIQKRSYGVDLRLYKQGSVEFFGPIEMPSDYRNNQ